MSQLTFRDLWEKCRDHLRYAQRIWWAFPCPSDCSKQHDNVAPGLATSGGLGWPVVAGVSRAGASDAAHNQLSRPDVCDVCCVQRDSTGFLCSFALRMDLTSFSFFT